MSSREYEIQVLTVSFEVFGKVQGVFFRKCTLAKALELDLKGWVQNKNNEQKSVTGVVQGQNNAVERL